jgi:hypothetical protein
MSKPEGSPRLTVEVTAEIIAASVQRDSAHCMIAEAIRAAYPGAVRVSADLQTIRFTDPARQRRYVYLTPRVGQVALIDFDQGDLPAPFKFRLRGAQVTLSGMTARRDHRAAAPRKPETERQRKQRAAALGRARLAVGTPSARASGEVPARVGGKRPPLSTFARRRAFGLRALDR